MRICVSLTEERTVNLIDRMIDLKPLADLYEIRADLAEELDLLTLLRARCRPMVFTCLPQSEGGRCPDDDPARHMRLLEAVKRGFDYVDVNLKSGLFDVMVEKAGRGLIVSFHDFAATPEDGELERAYEAMTERGADIAKIATMPKTLADVGRLLAFARRVSESDGGPPLLPIAMGPLGTPTRLLAGRYGAPFTFGAVATGREAAPGQVPAEEMIQTYRVRETGPTTRAYAVLQGDEDDALLPHILNAAFRASGVDAIAVPLEADSLESLVSALPALELSGLSVSEPYEKALVPELDDAEPATSATGRCDTVTMDESGRTRGSLSSEGRGVKAGSPEELLRRASVQLQTWIGMEAPVDVMREALARAREAAS